MNTRPLSPQNYSPLFFLNALGSGGLAVSFYMYLMWMTPHQGSPIPSFSHLFAAWNGNDLFIKAIMILGLLGTAVFSAYHVYLLAWNIRLFIKWKSSINFEDFKKSNAETQLMTLPLTFAMTVNVFFIVGAVFIPNLWEQREALFPIALIAFTLIGASALKTYLDFFTRVLTEGGFDCSKNNSLGQMISVFAFSMIGVGFSSVAAMGQDIYVLSIGFFGSIFFTSIALLLGSIKLVLGFRSMMEHRADAETTPTLWILIPILTVVGITLYRLKMGLMHSFAIKIEPVEITLFLLVLFSIQIFFGLVGWLVMKRVGYMDRWVYGPEKSAGVYALICPGVAFFVLANFVINIGLVKIHLIAPLSLAYGLFYLPLLYIQFVTIRLFLKLNQKMMTDPQP